VPGAARINAQGRADEPKNWISACGRPAGDNWHPELQRIVRWAASELNDFERIL
jgi:hypothetical protein